MGGFVITPGPAAYFGVGAIEKLPVIVRATGAHHVVVITDEALAAGPIVATVTDILLDAGLPSHVFDGVHPDPTTADLAAGAAAVATAAAVAATAEAAAAVAATLKASPSAPAGPAFAGPPLAGPSFASRVVLVAVGGGSPIDAAKGIALAAVNPERGRDLDCRRDFAVPGLPIVAVPTTAGPGAETSSSGAVTDTATHERFYTGDASTRPAAAVLDPALTVGLSPAATAATGMDALTHALESYLSLHPNPWSDGLALQAVRMIAADLPRAVRDGTDLDARSQLLLAAHLAGAAMASTGLGVCHAIGHSLGGRWNITHGVALSMLLPGVLRFNLPVRTRRLADLAFALGAGDSHSSEDRNAAAAVDAVAALRDGIGLTAALADFGITEADYAQIAADALADEVLRTTPRPPVRADIDGLLSGRVS
jgi:alcohol dehydrogenase